jgi:predicted AAA+ superfamily ATPase
MYFQRILDPANPETTVFIFGPRMTGKTTLLRNLEDKVEYFDLLDPVNELQYRSRPELFWQQVSALPRGTVIVIDEIQRVPELLNYVQMGIDRLKHVYILSGSSARKLKRGGANLLGGRALDLKLHPLTCREIKEDFNLDLAVQYGTLPKIYDLLVQNKAKLAIGHLRSYVTTYIKEEIQAEALTRNVGSFQRFLAVAAQSNGQVIEFSNISRESSVPASTVKEYYQILEDTMIGFLLWPFDHKERRKARPKAYFFDPGVVRAIQNRLQDPPTPQETGFLYETWLIGELIRIRDYMQKPHEFSFWRERDHEIDIIISDGRGPILAIECKSGKSGLRSATIQAFKKRFPDVRLIGAAMDEARTRKAGNLEIMSWKKLLQIYQKL